MKNYINLLQRTDLFKYISCEDLINLLNPNLYKLKSYKKNSIVYLKNEECKSCDVILKGNVLIQDIDTSGNVLTIREFSDGEILGENLLFSNNNIYPMTVFSKTDALILHMKKDLIFNLCKHNSHFLNNFLMSISNKTIILKDKVKKLSIKTIRECIVDFLIYQNKYQNSKIIKLDRTKKELAEEFGIQRTSFSRELNKMKKEGLIDYNSNSIIIVDLDLLLKINNE